MAHTQEQLDKQFSKNIWDGTIASSFAAGSGTQETPYLIATGAELAYLSKITNLKSPTEDARPGAYYKLIADIDLAGLKWIPIGQGVAGEGNGFCGTFDGNGHTIYNLKLHNGVINAGLFGYITTPEALPYSICNLTIKEANIVGDNYVSILAGYIAGLNMGNPKIINCHVHGKLIGKQYIGGIAGYMSYSEILNCSADVISNTQQGTAGAIVGETFNSRLTACVATGSVNGKYDIGGLAGVLFWDTEVKDCHSSAQVSSIAYPCGSFAGSASGYNGIHNTILSDCTASGNVICSYASTESQKTDGFIGKQIDCIISNNTFSGEIVYKPLRNML